MKGLIYRANLGFNGAPHYDRPRPMPQEDGVLIETMTGTYPLKHEAKWRSRERKILSPPDAGDAQWLLWLDTSLVPRGPMAPHAETWLKDHDLAIFKHPWRDCAYEEVDECVRRKKLEPRLGNEIKSTLALNSLPKHWGLWSCGAIAWSNAFLAREGIHRLRKAWWHWTQAAGFRDQIALPLALREAGMRAKLLTIDEDIYRFFDWVPHGR